MAPEKSLQEFIKDNIIQSDLRRDRTKILRQNAARFTYTDETVILPEE